MFDGIGGVVEQHSHQSDATPGCCYVQARARFVLVYEQQFIRAKVDAPKRAKVEQHLHGLDSLMLASSEQNCLFEGANLAAEVRASGVQEADEV